MKVWAHTLVKNEERYLWFAVKSVVNYVDKILLWDTGSTDKTVDIIKLLKKDHPGKIDFKEVGDVDINEFTEVRQEMLEESKCDWVMILDGDEVWWDKSIKNARKIIEEEGGGLDSLVHKYYNVVGDIYHYQEEKAGKYNIDSKVGHFNIRFLNRKITKLHFSKPHGKQGIYDEKNVLIQEKDPNRRLFMKDYYMHFTNMIRSSSLEKDRGVIKRNIKYKYELGLSFPKNFKYPEIFSKKAPDLIPDPWETRSLAYFVKALVQTPPKMIKRRIKNDEKVGY